MRMELSEARNQQKDKSRFAYVLCIFACVCVWGCFFCAQCPALFFHFLLNMVAQAKYADVAQSISKKFEGGQASSI